MAQAPSQTSNAASANTTTTVVLSVSKEQAQCTSPNLKLKLKKPKEEKKIQWTTDTVDNEYMGKKKSKCCCIYNKPRMFGESSSDESDGDETDHCRGHKGKCYHDSGGPVNEPNPSAQ